MLNQSNQHHRTETANRRGRSRDDSHQTNENVDLDLGNVAVNSTDELASPSGGFLTICYAETSGSGTPRFPSRGFHA